MRTFPALILAGALASGFPPAAPAAEEPTPEASPTAYTGKKFYAFDARWGARGSGPGQLDSPEDVKVLPDGRMLIADTGNNRVLVWGPNGEPRAAYGSFGTSATWRNPPQFNSPTALLAHPSKKIFVADTLNHRIVVLDESGLVNSSWGRPGKEDGQFNLPRTLTLDRYGNVWVLDSGNSRLQVFSALGVHTLTWGKFGTEPSFLNEPLGMAINQISQVILADTGNFRIQVFDEKGGPVTFQGWFGEGPYQFKEPAGVALTCNGMIAVTDSALGRIQFFNNRFEFVGQWSARDEIQDPGFKPRFRGVTCDEKGFLYLADAGNHAILRLKPVTSDAGAPPLKPTPTPADNDPYGGMGFPFR